MENQVEQLLKMIIIDQSPEHMIKQIYENQIMTGGELLDYIFNHIQEITSEDKLKILARSMSQVYIEQKDLITLHNKYQTLTPSDPMIDTKTKLIKSIVAGIGKKPFITYIATFFLLLGKAIPGAQVGHNDRKFLVEYAHLIAVLLENSL